MHKTFHLSTRNGIRKITIMSLILPSGRLSRREIVLHSNFSDKKKCVGGNKTTPALKVHSHTQKKRQ